MQHFPKIATPYNPIRTPYLGCRYHGGNFLTYPADQRPSYALESLQRHDIGQHGQEDVAQILQSWLYFGLLSEALQLNIIEDDFIKTVREGDRERQFITTEKLRDYIHQWRAAHELAKEDTSALAERRRRTVDALSVSHQAWAGFEDFEAIVGPEIQLSIQLLGCAIEHAVTSVYEGADTAEDTWIHVMEAPWRRTRSPFIEERMRQMGWCPSVVRQLGSPYKLSLQTFVSLLTPSFPSDASVHAKCDYGDVVCQWKNIDERTYQTRHAGDCECTDKSLDAFLHVDEGDLRKILEDGGIPIIYLDTQERDSLPMLKVVRYEYELQYTAISHVWADGLGNPRANALPLCQIKRIVNFLAKSKDSWQPVARTPPTRYFDSVWMHDEVSDDTRVFTIDELNSKPIYFWMDTLCVPPKAKDRDLRKAAIKSMRSVYNRANRVFVFDADLLATPGTLQSLSNQEILARVNASSWVRRYWTLQEALLAKKLLFQLADEPVRIIDPPDQTENFFLHFYDNEIGYYANNTDFMMRSRALNYADHGKVASIWSALSGRSTSHKADELICVATLLDMDLGKLLDLDEDDRMAELWKLYKEFPLGVLCRPAAKLEDPTVPWAFANISDCATIPTPTIVTVTQRNGVLHFWHHGLVIPDRLHRVPTSIIAVKIDQDVYFIRENVKSNNKPWNGIEFTSSSSRYAVVLGQDRPRTLDACLAALIEITVDAANRIRVDKVLKGKYLRAVSVVRRGSSFDFQPKAGIASSAALDRETVYEGVWLGSEQQWEVRGHTGGD